MPKKKRTFTADVVTPYLLQLQNETDQVEERQDQTYKDDSKKQYFPEELIVRLAERIKKL